MKFTLDAGGAQAAGQGIGSIFKALAMAPQVRQQAEQDAIKTGADIYYRQMAGQKFAADAQKNNAEADLSRQKLAFQQNPLENAMFELGLPTNLAPAFRSKLETGSFGAGYDTPAVDGVGPVMPAPADNDTVAKLGRSIALLQRMNGTGSNVDQGAAAGLKEQQMRQIDEAVRNTAMVDRIGAAQAAGSGKVYDLFGNVGTTGGTMNKRTGDAGPVDERIANIFDAVERAKAGASNASAANSYAAAAENKAQTQKIRQDIQMGGQSKAPTGYRFTPVGDLQAIPGGPADIKAGELGAKRAMQQRASLEQADRVIGKVDQTLATIGLNTAGFGGSVLGKLPGTDASDLASDLNTIKANLGFAELQAMRDASPTGGALGAIAVQELLALQSTVASLDQTQSPAQLRRNLGEVRERYANWRNVVQKSADQGAAPASGAPEVGGGAPSSAPPVAINSDAEYNALPSGAFFTAPDGSQRRKP